MLNTRPLYLYRPITQSLALQEPVDQFYEERWNEIHELEDHTTLYHYTDIDGLRGIISSRQFWCSHISSLNDPLEIQYGQDLVLEVIEGFIADNDRADLRHLFKSIAMHVRNFGTVTYHSFVFCFCESGDLLSQWRAYANQGGGYCLGFDFSEHTVVTPEYGDPDKTKPVILRKVVYSREEQKSLVEDYLGRTSRSARQKLDEMADAGNERHLAASMIAMHACNVLLDMLLCFKHEAFAEEKEWRIIKVTRGDFNPEFVEFRINGETMIPYRPLFIYEEINDVMPLKSIRFGPTLDGQSTRSAIELFVQKEAASGSPIHLLAHDVDIDGPQFSLR